MEYKAIIRPGGTIVLSGNTEDFLDKILGFVGGVIRNSKTNVVNGTGNSVELEESIMTLSDMDLEGSSDMEEPVTYMCRDCAAAAGYACLECARELAEAEAHDAAFHSAEEDI